MRKIDYNKTIFIINTLTIAMNVSIIANSQKINCIFEKMEGWQTDYSFQMLKNFSKKCINIGTSIDIEVPNFNFLRGKRSDYRGFLARAKQFRKDMDKAFCEQEDYIYIGPGTSAIMQSLRSDKNRIYYIFHGTGDNLSYFNEFNNSYNNKPFSLRLKVGLRKMVIGNLIGLPNSYMACFMPTQGWSMCDMKNSDIEWIDFMKFSCKEIEKGLAKLNSVVNEKSVVFCPMGVRYTEKGLDTDTRKLNDRNISILKDTVTKGDTVFFKFHYSVYSGNDSMISNLKECIYEKLQIESFDIADFIPDDIGGVMLPVEILFRYCNFKKLICDITSAAWNMASRDDIFKFLNIKYSGDTDKYFCEHHINMMKKLGNYNSSFHYQK